MTERPDPAPVPLGLLSPTAANDLLTCAYRLAWRLDPRFRALRRPTPLSSLGLLAHAVAEDVAKRLTGGTLSEPDIRAAVEASWERHLATATRALEAAWAPAAPPPAAEWPGYHLTRARLIRRVMRQLDHSRESTTLPAAAPTLVETTLEDPALGLVGRPDRVEGKPANRCVVDLKTRLTQAQPTDQQRLQLLVYAHLVKSTTGDMPTRIAIEDPSGRRLEQRITAREVETAVHGIQRARSRYEAVAAAGQLRKLAAPGPDSCRHCPYRVVCGPYWDTLQSTWSHPSVAGRINKIRPGPHSSTILIDATSPIDARGPGWIVTGVPEAAVPNPGLLALTGAESTGAPRHLRWRWSTMTWTG